MRPRSIDGLMKAVRLTIQGLSAASALADRPTGLVIQHLWQNANFENATDPNMPIAHNAKCPSCKLFEETNSEV